MHLPKEIQHKKNSNVLQVIWSNGEISSLNGDRLRQYCACATCRAKNHVGVQLIGDNGVIESLKLMGSTGVQIVFADGHDRGVFPWGYLQAIANGNPYEFLSS